MSDTGGSISARMTSLMAIVLLLVSFAWPAAGSDERMPTERVLPLNFGIYNLLGYEGIPTLGSTAFTKGTPPPVGDYVTTHCRYIDVMNTGVGEYYLRYPLHLPDGAQIGAVSLYVADFNPSGVLWAYLRDRPWSSRDAPTTRGSTLTDNSSEADKQINIGSLSLDIDNSAKSYWIDVTPTNGISPGQLCVYGIQVIYDCTQCVLFADGFESGSVSAWGSSAP